MPKESVTLYNGEITVEFEPGKHKYTVLQPHKKPFKPPSVTTITGIRDKSGPLKWWAVSQALWVCSAAIGPGMTYTEDELTEIWRKAKNQHAWTTRKAAEIGSAAHKWGELYFRGENPSMPDKEAEHYHCVQAILNWANRHNVSMIANERILYSKKHKYTGRMDGRAMVDGKLSLIDFKTGNGIHDEVWLQTAAYENAEREEAGTEYEQRVVIRLGKEDGKFYHHVSPPNTFKKDFKAFLGAKALFERCREIGNDDRYQPESDWIEEL